MHRMMKEIHVFVEEGDILLEQPIPDQPMKMNRITIAPEQVETLVKWLQEAKEKSGE